MLNSLINLKDSYPGEVIVARDRIMWSTTLANWKENLNKIALDVHDDDDEDEELSIYNNRQDSDRRISHSFARSPSVSNSPVANGFDSPSNSEVNYKVHLLFFSL